MISATYNQLNHGKMLLSSLEKPGMPDHPEEPTKEPIEDFIVQEAANQPLLSILSSQQTTYEGENYSSSFNSCTIPLAINTVGVHSSTTTYNSTRTKWLKNSQEALKPDSADLYSAPLKDSIGNLEIEIVRLQAEKNEQKKRLEIKEKLLFQVSKEKRLLQEALQESNTLLHMWALKNEQYWREPNNGLHEQQEKVHITAEQINFRLETKKEKDHGLQELYMPQNSSMTSSQEISAVEKENDFCVPVTVHYDKKRGQDQHIIHSEKDTLEFTTIPNIVNDTEAWCVQLHSEKKDCISNCNMIRENSDKWSQMVSTVQTNLHPLNPVLKSDEGYHIKKQLSPEKETSKQLNEVQNVEQQYNFKLSLSDETDTCLLNSCSLDKQLDRYSQQVLSVCREKDSKGQKVQLHDESDSKNLPDDLQYSFSKILCTLKKDIDLISHKVEAVEKEKQSYLDKIHSLERAFSKATQEVSVLQEEKRKYSEKIFVLEREKENYAQQVHLLEQENRDSSNQIILMTEYRSKISLLEEEKNNYSQKISTLMTEVADYSQKVLQLQKENENYSQNIFLLESEKKRHCDVSCEIKEKADLYLQKISTLEQDNARYSQQICVMEKENIILYEKLNSIEKEIDRCSLKITDSYETHSEYTPVLSTLLKVTTKGSHKNDYPVVESNRSTIKVCSNKNSSSQVQNDNSSVECSETTNKSEGLDAENISQKLISLEQKKCTFFRLISDLAEAQQRHSQQIPELLQDKEMYLKKVYNIEEEKVKCSEKNDELAVEKQTLLGHLNSLKREKEEHLKEMSKIEEDYAKCRDMLAQQQKDNTRLRNKIHKVRKEASDKVVASKEATYSIMSENKNLKELILHLKGNYENVIKDTMFGMEEMIKGLEKENESLLNRIHQMETETASEISKQMEQILKEREQLINRIGELEDELRFKENASCILEPSNNGNVLSQDSFVAGEASEVVSMQQAHVGYPKNSNKVSGCEIIDKELDRETNLALIELRAISEAHDDSQMAKPDGQTFDKGIQCNVSEYCGLLFTTLEQQHISAKCRIVDGSQQSNETEATKDLLQQKVLSLESKLQDEAAFQKQLSETDEGVHLFNNKCGKRLKKRTENELFSHPLKAKLASLIQKCQDRNNFITQLVKELQRIMEPPLIEETTDLISPLTHSDSVMSMNCLQLPFQSDFSHHLLLSLCEAPTRPEIVSPKLPEKKEHSFKLDGEHPGQMQHLSADAITGGSISACAAKRELPNVLSASPVRRSSEVEKTPSPEPLTATRIKQGSPTAVDSVYIIKAIGKCNLMIGWGRPTVDELGCSNGIFIQGYRIYVNGNFHKSIMSSACTKTILENLDLSVPFQVSVQTVGGNGLVSGKVHAHFSACFDIRAELPSTTSNNSEAEQCQ
ncbi:uncharacterized protein C4orf50 homolog [Lissotriton helveticus]